MVPGGAWFDEAQLDARWIRFNPDIDASTSRA
jgi:hypothetical protein